MRKFVIGGKLAILPPGGSPVGMYTHPICHQRALLIIQVQAHGRTRLSPSDYSVPLGPIESLGGTGPTFEVLGGTRAFQAHLDPRLHSQDWWGGGGARGVVVGLGVRSHWAGCPPGDKQVWPWLVITLTIPALSVREGNLPQSCYIMPRAMGRDFPPAWLHLNSNAHTSGMSSGGFRGGGGRPPPLQRDHDAPTPSFMTPRAVNLKGKWLRRAPKAHRSYSRLPNLSFLGVCGCHSPLPPPPPPRTIKR